MMKNEKHHKFMIQFYKPQTNGRIRPMITAGIPAGSPLQMSDEFTWVDLDEYLSNNLDETIYGSVVGFSMIEADIHEGDILVINTSIEPTNGDVCVVRLNGETTCKFWKDIVKMGYNRRHLFLVPANSDYNAIQITKRDEIEIIGVVDYAIHKIRHR